ncbi:hypothetical protein BVG19_g761 [[Candida] boidinii]|nr:hypothetical protein BVG19_g761 [[Candida] boidinii]OWB50773.1 hypothetical protein B5S27_g2326 [[Candida] boidinii]
MSQNNNSQYTPNVAPPLYNDIPGGVVQNNAIPASNNNNDDSNNNKKKVNVGNPSLDSFNNFNEQEGFSSERNFDDNLPNDFKYSTNVAACSIEIRQLFIRKVYTLLSLQLLVTFISGFIISVNDPVKQFCLNNVWLLWVSIGGSFVFLGLAYWKSRSYPWNLLSLLGFTLCESYLVGLVSALSDSQAVVEAVLITMFVFIGLTAFSFQTSYDFTQWQGWAMGALFFLIGLGFFGMFISKSNGSFDLVYGIIGAIIFSIFIVIDTQLIMRRYHPEEEVPATITLYLDIINLFLKVLAVLNNRNDRS